MVQKRSTDEKKLFIFVMKKIQLSKQDLTKELGEKIRLFKLAEVGAMG